MTNQPIQQVSTISSTAQFTSKDTPPTENNVPVKIETTAAGDLASFKNSQMQVTYTDPKDKQQLAQQSIRSLVLAQINLNASQQSQVNTKIIVLGRPIEMPLPKQLEAYINATNIKADQLATLANRAQGYALGDVIVAANRIRFNENLALPIPANTLTKGQYIAAITSHQGNLQLVLTPKQAQVNVTLTPISSQSAPSDPLNSSSAQGLTPENTLMSKPELASAYHRFNQALSNIGVSPEIAKNILKELSQPSAQSGGSTLQRAVPNLNLQELEAKTPLPSKPANMTIVPLRPDTAAASNKLPAILPGPITPSRLIQSFSSDSLSTNQIIRQSGLFNSLLQTTLFLRPEAAAVDIPSQLNSLVTFHKGDPIAMAANKALLTRAMQTGSQQITGEQSTLQNQPQGQSISLSQTLGLHPPQSQRNHRGLNLALNQVVDNNMGNTQATRGQTLQGLLQQLLPLTFPRPLSQLASTSILQQELLDGLAGISQPASPLHQLASNINSHAGTIGVLFQLLLGRQVQKNAQSHSAKNLQALQQLGASSRLLGLLEKSGAFESVGKLVANLSLYQQASSDNAQSTQWYFTLPYMIDHRHEELEGHFAQEHQDKDDSCHWRLQLKFNVAAGSLLINADVKQGMLNLQFTSESDTVLEKINTSLNALETKISAIGLRPKMINTQKSQVPASLLPGEHYLVKIKA